MEAQQTFIIEASRQTSIENNANLQDTNSAWTNRIEPTLLKKGDYISVNTAIVNQKGASGANNIEFSDAYNNPKSNLQQNFTLLNVGFYLNNNNVNSCPLPFKYLKANTARTNPEKVADAGGRVRITYDEDLFREVDGNQIINNKYGMAKWYEIFANDYESLTPQTADSLGSFTAMNPNIKIDGSRYAKVSNNYVGWNRPNGGGLVETDINLMTQNIPIHIEKGFKDASSVGNTITRILQSTEDPYSNQRIYALPESTLATLAPNEIAQTQTNPRFNGYCMKTIGANLQAYKDGTGLSDTDGVVGNSPLYNNLCVEEPYIWEYGSRLLSNVKTFQLKNNPNINTNYLALNPHINQDYPVLLWSTYTSGEFGDGNIQNLNNYDFYSPHYTQAVNTEHGVNVIEWNDFSGIMSDYNDDYGEILDYDDAEFTRGTFIMKNGTNSYRFYDPQTNDYTPEDPNDATKKLAFRTFIDDDNPTFDRITAFSAKNQIESSNWSVLGESIIDWVFANFYKDVGTNNADMFQQPQDAGGAVEDSFSMNNASVGATRLNYMYGFVPYGNRIIEGKKYRVSFWITQFIGDSYDTFNFGLADRLSSFGFPGLDVDDGDGFYSIEFTATADSSSVANFMFYFRNNITANPTFSWIVEDFEIFEFDIEVGDKYVISDIFTPTTADTTKLYKMKIDDGQLRSEKLNITDSSLGGGLFNKQFTVVANMRAYKSGSSVVAFDGSYNDYPNAVILMYQEDPTYDYVIWNQYGNKTWYMAEITKYTGNNIQSGDTIGTVVGWYNELKDPYRTGQQYYDFSVGNNWGDTAYPSYDWSSGNTWIIGGGTNIDFTMTSGVAGGVVGAFDFYWVGGGATVYARFDGGVSTAISGTAMYSGDAVAWNRTWSFDIAVGVNGTLTQMIGATSYIYTPTQALTVTYTPIVFTNHIADPLPTIVDGLTTYEYFASVPIEDRTKPLYDYSTGNTWTPLIGGAPILFTMVGGTSPYGEYDFSFANSLGTLTVYARYNGGNDWETHGTFAYSGSTGFTDTWSFDIDVGTNGTMTHTYGATSYTYEPIGALSVTYPSKIYYLGAHDDLQGKTGRLIYSDGAGGWVTDKVWHWDGDLGMNLDDPTISLIATSTPTLTNIIAYETGQDRTIGGQPYTFPIDGRQYGYSGAYRPGNTESVTDLHIPLPVSSQAIDELFLGVDMKAFGGAGLYGGYSQGLVYESEHEALSGNAICKWSLKFLQTLAIMEFNRIDNDELLLSLEEDLSNISRYGWYVFKSSKYNYGINPPDVSQNLTIQGGENYYSNVRTYNTTGADGRYLPNGTHNFQHDTGTSEFLENQNLERFNANMPQSTMLMTNIEFTLDNLSMVKDYFRYTEVYEGDVESSRKNIVKDVDNFYSVFDLGRSNDDKLQIDRTEKPYTPSPYNAEPPTGVGIPETIPLVNFTMRDYGVMGVDDSDTDQFTDYNGTVRKGSNKNYGCIAPRMVTEENYEQRIDIFTRWKDGYENRLIATNRLEDKMSQGQWVTQGQVYGKSIGTDKFQKQYSDLYNYCVDNNIGAFPYLAKDWNDRNDDNTYNYVLCMAFETYRNIDIANNYILKIQDGTFVGFSPSFLDHNYIMPMNLDTPYVCGISSTPEAPNQGNPPSSLILPVGYAPSIRKEDNQNHINIGAAPSIVYNPELNRFQFQYLHTPYRFNMITGTAVDLEEEVGFLNSSKLMIMGQGIGENNLESGGSPEITSGDPPVVTPAVAPTNIHMGLADSQCGVFIHDIFGQTPSNTFIRNAGDGTLIDATNYDNTLFWTLGFSYYDLKPIRFSETSFNNRFNSNTYNVISGDFKKLGTSPFTTNSALSVGDQQKTNIFTGIFFQRYYNPTDPYKEQGADPEHSGLVSNSIGGTPAFYLGYNNLLDTSIKTTSALMTSRSVIVNLTSPFYRIYCNLPLDTLTYLSSGSLSCAGYMTKNYQSQSFIYSFASDYGGFLTRDVLITDLRTEIRDPNGLLVNSIDSNSAVFYKVARQIVLQSGLTPDQEKAQAEQLLARQQQEAEEATEIRNVSMDVIKYFKTLFTQSSGGGNNTTELTNLISEPSGVQQVYQQIAQDTQTQTTQPQYAFTDAQLKDIYNKYPELQRSAEKLPEILEKEADLRRGIETKEEGDDRPTVPLLNFEYLEELTQQQSVEPYTPRQHRLFLAMGDVIENALNTAQMQSPTGMMDLSQLQEDIKGIQLTGEVVESLVKDLGRIHDRKELRKLVEHIAKRNDPNGDKATQKKFATKVMRLLKVAQDRTMELHPNLMGKNPFKITRKKRTKVQMTEARAMGREDPREIRKEKEAKDKTRERESMGREDIDARKKPKGAHILYKKSLGKTGKQMTKAEKDHYHRLNTEFGKQYGKKMGAKESRSIYKSPIGHQHGTTNPIKKWVGKATPKKKFDGGGKGGD